MFHSMKIVQNQLRQIYGWQDEKCKGRSISLISALLTSVYNVFITGIFYTGFLSMYEINLVGIGIITFISPLANCFSLFSPMVLERIQKRKWLLAGAKIYYYFMIIIATNLMPLIVTDADQRVLWFCLLQFLATSVYAIFSAGFTPWFYQFYPQDPSQKIAYLSYNQIFSSIVSSCVLLLSGGLSAAVRSSDHQNTLILGMRYLAFLLVLLDVFFQVQAKEYPYPLLTSHVHLREIFQLSLRHPKYMRCLLIMFAWSYIGALNSGTWNYFEQRGFFLWNDQSFQRFLHRHAALIHAFLAKSAGPPGLDPHFRPLCTDLDAVRDLFFLSDAHYQMDVSARGSVSEFFVRRHEPELFQYFLPESS